MHTALSLRLVCHHHPQAFEMKWARCYVTIHKPPGEIQMEIFNYTQVALECTATHSGLKAALVFAVS